MFPTSVRLVLILACFGVGAYQIFSGNRDGLWLVGASSLFAYGHFRYGPVWLAFRSLQAGKLDRDQDDKAERHLRLALGHELRTENDRCIAEVELAEILVKRGELAEARELIAQARTRDCKPAFVEQIERVAASLESSA